MFLVELLEHFLVQGVVLLAVRIDLGNDAIEVGVRPQRSLAHQLLATRGTLLVARSQRRNDAVVTEPVQALFRRHRVLQYVQADGAHELVLQYLWRDGDLGAVAYDVVRHPVELVDVQLPCLVDVAVRLGFGGLGRRHVMKFVAIVI